ncbi:hypothetical protein QD712_20160 [Streptomyces acidiscabies]|uniref:hypothetical protein n=1 Tax=Streptomyces acidiscabies TaxID=42234 RepID=UPI0030CF9C99
MPAGEGDRAAGQVAVAAGAHRAVAPGERLQRGERLLEVADAPREDLVVRAGRVDLLGGNADDTAVQELADRGAEVARGVAVPEFLPVRDEQFPVGDEYLVQAEIGVDGNLVLQPQILRL